MNKSTILKSLACFTLFLCCGCTQAETQAEQTTGEITETLNEDTDVNTVNDAENAIEEASVLNITADVDLLVNVNDPASIAEYSTYAVIADVVSIDGCSAYNASTGKYGEIYTYGKLSVHECLMGDLNAGDVISFMKPGGVVTWDEYEKSLHDAEKEKVNSDIKEIPKYVSYMVSDDIEIEEGKTYLIFLWQSPTPAIEDAVCIQGYQGGLREFDAQRRLVLNNTTGEWESLDEIAGLIQQAAK